VLASNSHLELAHLEQCIRFWSSTRVHTVEFRGFWQLAHLVDASTRTARLGGWVRGWVGESVSVLCASAAECERLPATLALSASWLRRERRWPVATVFWISCCCRRWLSEMRAWRSWAARCWIGVVGSVWSKFSVHSESSILISSSLTLRGIGCRSRGGYTRRKGKKPCYQA